MTDSFVNPIILPFCFSCTQTLAENVSKQTRGVAKEKEEEEEVIYWV